jgi:hypothetical protein
MDFAFSSSTIFVRAVMAYIITIYYWRRRVRRSLFHPISPRRLGPRVQEHCRRCASGKFWSSAGLGMPRRKTFLKVTFKSLQSREQQRWAERPHPSLPSITPSSYSVTIPPFIPSQRSVHRYCSWILPVHSPLPPSGCFAPRGMETLGFIKTLIGPHAIESLMFITLNSFRAHRQAQDAEPDPSPVPNQDFPPARTVQIEGLDGQGFSVWVKNFNPAGFRSDGPQPGPPILMVSARPNSARRPLRLLARCLPILSEDLRRGDLFSYPLRTRHRQPGDL